MSRLPHDFRSGDIAKLFKRSWIGEVVKTPDADMRSHMITLTYSAYSRALDYVIHGDEAPWRCLQSNRSIRRESVDVNWFAFATWATASVGRNIRLDEAPQRVGSVPAFVRRRITPAVIHARASDGQRVSRALSWGQRLIFVNVVNSCRELIERTPLAPDDVDELSTWNGTKALSDAHRDNLVEAFAAYGKAAQQTALLQEVPPDDAASLLLYTTLRARYVFLGNALLTAVEQDLVDQAVRTVVDFIPERVTGVFNGYVSQLGERFLRVPRQLTQLRMIGREDYARHVASAAWARLLTDQVFVMTLPCETLRVGRDIPHRNSAMPFYPAALQDLAAIDHLVAPLPTADAELIGNDMTRLNDLVSSFDRSRVAGAGTAATDWRRFDERMNWALALLRSRHQDETLFWPPYRVEDIGSITSSRLPKRGGDPADLQVMAPADGSAVTLA